jgi:hypothetical protein
MSVGATQRKVEPNHCLHLASHLQLKFNLWPRFEVDKDYDGEEEDAEDGERDGEGLLLVLPGARFTNC